MRYKSSEHGHMAFVYTPLIVSLSFVFVLVVSLVSPELLGDLESNNVVEDCSFLLFAIIVFTSLSIFFYKKMRILSVDSKGVVIENSDVVYEWAEIEKLNKIGLVYPPLYKIHFSDGKYVMFCSGYSFIHYGVGVKDNSEMIRYIERMLKND